MARIHVLTLIGAMAWLGGGMPAQGQQPQPGITEPEDQQNVIYADDAVTRATVTDIDYAQRTVRLQTESGREVPLRVDPSVKNFDQVKKGDPVTVKYHEAIAVMARTLDQSQADQSGSAAPLVEGSEKVVVTGPDQSPGVTVTKMTTSMGTVEAVDHERRLMILRAPGGPTRTLNVSASMPDFDRIKAGDVLVVRHTEAVAINVTK